MIYLPGIMLLTFSLNITAQPRLTDYVNPFIGTGGHGHTYPGPSLPFGMVQLSPDTDNEGWDWCSGYHYTDNTLLGFSHTHLSGTGIGDYGDILFMPTTGELQLEPGTKENPDAGYRSRFSHENEIAKAGYYSVHLDDYSINAELTTTRRAGFHKYLFENKAEANIIIDLVHGIQDQTTDAGITFVDDNTIQGYRRSTGWADSHCVYFYAEFSKSFKSFGISERGEIKRNITEAKGKEIKAFIHYDTSPEEVILVKVGISHTSIDGARKNLLEEIPSWDFDLARKLAEDEWEKLLSIILVESKNESLKRIFYTALYHALLAPNIFSDVDGKYIGMDNKIHSAGNGKMYSVFSLWDTFRAAHPLFTIIDKDRAEDFVRSLITKYNESGLLPVWELASNETETMIGYHSISVIADAYFKGLRNFDVDKAFDAMKNSAMQDHHGLNAYKEMGFISSDLEHESVSKTLEYAYDDWCIAQMAKDLGKEDDYNYFIERAKYYINVFDPSTSLMRAKKNGRWFEPFDPFAVSGNYTEANAWQYSFFVPHDLTGLMKLMGGKESFINKLDELFSASTEVTGRVQADITGLIGQYAHGNEPSHHMAYLYNYAGAPWKTQKTVHKILTELYTDKPDGLSGNEDCGQMSAWYVLSAIGFYPVCPGDNNYIIGTPLFDKVTINLGKGKYFTVETKNLSDDNFYIKSAGLNGEEYNYSYLKYTDIMNGSKLEFEMSDTPGGWGKEPESNPVSSVDFNIVPVPFLTSGEKVFKDSTSISISCMDSSLGIYFSTDGSDPLPGKRIYSGPITINKSTKLKAVSYVHEPQSGGMNHSKTINAVFNKIPEGKNIKLYTKYHYAYTGGGDYGLIDNVKGNSNFRTDAWQGYEGVDLDAEIDLGSVRKISYIGASFLENIGSWIFLPSVIEFSVSKDGINYSKIYRAENIIEQDRYTEEIKNYEKVLEGIETRFVKVYAKNIGTCPQWHIGAGGKAWIFIDEITIK
jgi:predicted alpha-1,2-mannosidase